MLRSGARSSVEEKHSLDDVIIIWGWLEVEPQNGLSCQSQGTPFAQRGASHSRSVAPAIKSAHSSKKAL